MQEMSAERWIDIPNEVRDMFRQWRPSPLYRARALEKKLDTPARIYYKYEGTNATGSHKLNTALPQAYYNKAAGIKRIGNRNRSRTMGKCYQSCCKSFWTGLRCLHGKGQL